MVWAITIEWYNGFGWGMCEWLQKIESPSQHEY